MTESTDLPLFGLWKPRPLQALFYGPSSVNTHLLSQLPSSNSKAFIITGNSLATKTPLVKDLQTLLAKHHAGTFSKIGQHAPVAQLDEATSLITKDNTIDTLISLGGGSPIDSAKAISYRNHQKTGRFLHHICIPTTLSAAECTALAGYTEKNGIKTGVADPGMAVNAIFYDPGYAKHTPTKLWLSTGMRAMDHAMESMYHPTATEMPAKAMCLQAAATLFELLPVARKTHPGDEDTITRLFLAAYMSLGFMGQNMKGGLGLSHSLGYALGSPYGIPHGETSCLTLGNVVKLKAKGNQDDAKQIARMLNGIGGQCSGNPDSDAQMVGNRINRLVDELGLHQSLTERGVGKDQVDVITSRATGGMKEGPMFDAVKGLVEGLW